MYSYPRCANTKLMMSPKQSARTTNRSKKLVIPHKISKSQPKWPAKATTTKADRHNTPSNPTGKLAPDEIQPDAQSCDRATTPTRAKKKRKKGNPLTHKTTAHPQANTNNSSNQATATALPRPSNTATSSLPWATSSRLRSSRRPSRRRTAGV